MHDYYTENGVKYKELDFLKHPGYRVGEDGSVWSKWTKLCLGKKLGFKWVIGESWKQLKHGLDKYGYRHVVLNGKQWKIHKLVLLAFVGPCPEGMEACHYPDQDTENNRLSNLSWGTKSRNMAHKKENGTWAGLENNPSAKLTNDQVKEIRRLYKPYKMTLDELAKMFNVSNVTIQKIVYHKNWNYIP